MAIVVTFTEKAAGIFPLMRFTTVGIRSIMYMSIQFFKFSVSPLKGYILGVWWDVLVFISNPYERTLFTTDK